MTAEAKKYAKVIESATRLQDKESRIKTIEEGLIRYASAKAEEVAIAFYDWVGEYVINMVQKHGPEYLASEEIETEKLFAQYKLSK